MSAFQFGALQVRALELGAAEIRISQVASDEARPSQIRTDKQRTSERRAVELRPGETCAFEIGRDGDLLCANIGERGEIGAREVGAAKMRAPECCAAEVRPHQLRAAQI